MSATGNGRRGEDRPLAIADEANAVTIRITGAAWQNLSAIAAIVGRWNETRYTPADIVRRFMCNGGDWINLAERKPSQRHCTTLAGSICDCYDSEPDRGELEAQLNAAGFLTRR